jgi:NleD-like pathogen effector protein (putative zinc metallopeptidase)
MSTRTHQAPQKGAQTPARSGSGQVSAFQPRPFGETALSTSSPRPVPDFETQIERAGRFGHNLAHLSVPPSGEAPIQRNGDETEEQKAKRLAREADKAKLSGMLSIVDQHDIAFGTDRPNDVTRKELDELAELYSKIREGDSHVKFANQSRTDRTTITDNVMSGEEFTTFKGKAMDDIAKILQTPQGRTLMKSLAAGGKSGTSDVTIGAASNPLHGGAGPLDRPKASDGTGSSSVVYYGAGSDVDLPQKAGPLTTTSDTALFHELVHAYHSGQGTRKKDDDVVGVLDTVFGGAADVDIGVKREEYATVGLDTFAGDALTENAYRASHRELAGSNQALADKYKKRQTYY